MRRTAEDIAKSLGGATKLGDGGWKCRCPAHNDSTSSLGVKDSKGKLLLKCYAGCSQEQVIDALVGLDLWQTQSDESKASWTPVLPVPVGNTGPASFNHYKFSEPKRRWVYRDEEGNLLGFVCRFEKVGPNGKVDKTPMPMSWCASDDGRHEWRWKSFEKPRPMYGLEKLGKRPKDPVAIFEGEKSADAAQELFPDYVCLAWPGGTKAVKYVDFKPMAGRDVTLWPDADEVGRKAMAQVGEILFVEGATRVKVVPVPEWVDEYRAPGQGPDEKPAGQGWDVADDLLPGMDPVRTMLDAAGTYEPEGGDVVEQFNRRYALVLMGGKTSVIRETKDPDTGKTELAYISPDAFAQFHANARVPVGRASVPAGKFWLTHESRRSYEGVTFLPGRTPKGYYNLWRGFSVDPDPTGDWSIYREHLLNNAAQGNVEHFNWILGWLAHIVQFPHRKAGTSLSFRGKQGTGKTIIGQIFGRLLRQHYTLVADSRYLFNNFNSHLASTILLHSDEGFWGGDPRHVGKLRAMVTSDTQWIENKRIDPVEVRNFMRLLITTNQDWVVPAAAEERRFAVFDMGDGNIQDKKFFVEMTRQMRDGGYGGLIHDLMSFDLTAVDVERIPVTAALTDQKEASLTDVAKFWMYCLTEAEILPGGAVGWPGEVSSRSLYEACLEHLENLGVRYRPTPTQFSKEVEKLAPPDTMRDVKRMIAGKTRWCVTLPDLEAARTFFDQTHGSTFAWKREKVEVEAKVADEAEYDIPF